MLANLRALFGVVVDIILLRRGPENLPASPVLFGFVLVVYLVVSALVAASVAGAEQAGWPIELAIGTVSLLLWYRVALQLANKKERFHQTMTAMFAVITIFTPLLVPMLNGVAAQIQAKQEPSQGYMLLSLFLIVWLVVIFVRAISSAFEWQWPAAFMMVVGQQVFSFFIFALVFGVPARG